MKVKIDMLVPNVGHKGGKQLSSYTWPKIRTEGELMIKMLELRPLKVGVEISINIEED